MLGLHFVLGIIPARPPFPHTKPQRTLARRSAIPSAHNHSAKGRPRILTKLVLGGRSMGFSPCRPLRSRPTQASR